MKKNILVGVLIFTLAILSFDALSSSRSSVKQDLLNIKQQIKEATEKSNQYTGGLIKSLVDLRIELLQINKSILEGKKISQNRNFTTKPDNKKANEIFEDLVSLKKEIDDKKKESDGYRGGLIKAMLESAIATSETSLAMLQAEYYKSKYGIYWMPQAKVSSSNVDQPKSKKVTSRAKNKSKNISTSNKFLVPMLVDKRYQARDFSAGISDSSIWFDIEWDTSKLVKPIRAIKGVVVLSDLFDEEKFRIGWTINNELIPGQNFAENGMGFEYNQFRDSHKWVRQTDIKDIKISYEVKSVIYKDGSTEKFK